MPVIPVPILFLDQPHWLHRNNLQIVLMKAVPRTDSRLLLPFSRPPAGLAEDLVLCLIMARILDFLLY